MLFVSYSGWFGGAERLLLDVAGAAPGDAAIACPEGTLAYAARARGLRVFPLRERSLHVRGRVSDRLLAGARLVGHALEVERLVRNLEPLVVVAWSMRSGIACRIVPRRGYALAFAHNDFLPGRLGGSLVRWAAGRAELITAPSHAVAIDLDPRGRLGERLEVIHPGVDVDRLAADCPPATPPEVITLGALTPWKRPEVALEACALARRQRPDLRLRLVGAPLDHRGAELLEQLRARARAPDLAGAVEFPGAAEDPRAALTRASCFLHCAAREPFGLAVLEALAVGRPAIVPAVAGPAEIVDSSCGILYPAGDAAAAARAIVAVVDDPERAARLGAAGRERARRRFHRRATERAYAQALARLERRARAARRAPRQAAASDLSLVTVAYNSAAYLPRLLESLERHLSGSRVIVVDCGSEDDSVAVARTHLCTLVVEAGANLGFGAANNRGLRDVRTPVTALVNPDVEAIDDSLLALAAEAMWRDRGERLLAPLVLNPDGSRQDTVHPRPASAADLLRALISPSLVGLPAVAPWRAAAPRRVGWAVGCALVARTDTLRRLGPFDERLFLYGEDLDLGLRAARAGVETWFWPGARVLHHRGHSTTAAFGAEPFEQLARARREVVARRLGRGRQALDDAAQGLTFASRIVAKRALGRPARRERRQLEALRRARG